MGIGGSGASAIASIAQAQGFEVSGCDRNPFNEFTTHFEKDSLIEGHSVEHLTLSSLRRQGSTLQSISKLDSRLRGNDKGDEQLIDILAISPAITSLDPDNKELKVAREQGIEVMTWQEFMGKYLEEGKFVIAICGTHGKSTTTAMVAHVLEEAGLDPTVEIGAIVGKWGKNYRIGSVISNGSERSQDFTSRDSSTGARNDNSKYDVTNGKQIFVTEADEFNENFLVSHPDITVLNNLDMDHPEYYKDFEAYIDAFDKFLMQNKGTIIANLADKNVAELLKWTMKHTSSTCIDFNKNEIQLDLKVIGEHNILNAKAAFQVGLLLDIAPQQIISALNSFTGIGRRQELLGEVNFAEIYSDYAHHPKELEVTIKAFRAAFPKKSLIIVFQPHMFTRTKALFNDFVEVFKSAQADQIIITDIFQSREKDLGDINSKMLFEAVNKQNVWYIPRNEVISHVQDSAAEDEVIVFCGAGDIDKIARNWVNMSSRR